MSTENRKPGSGEKGTGAPGKGVWLLPVVLALPFLAGMIFAALRFGPQILKLISAAVKATVVV